MNSKNKVKVAVVTGSRAEYGLLKMTLEKIKISEKLDLNLIVTGSHLSSKFGSTYKVIEEDGFDITSKIDMLLDSDSPVSIAKSIGLGQIGFAQVYDHLKPDVILFLGDRYEILCAAIAALPFNILLVHIAGGEISEGAIDDQIRHSLTKLSHLHLACSEFAVNTIKSIGEEDWRIHNVGHPGIELIKNLNLFSKKSLVEKFKLDPLKKIYLVTLHPTTLDSEEKQKTEAKSFFEVLKNSCGDANVVITSPNADTNNQIILNEIEKLKDCNNITICTNLGSQLYLSFMNICDLVLGNSSSGIGEGPYFKVPVINFGNRQKGRQRSTNIIDASDEFSFKQAIHTALYDIDFRNELVNTMSVYGIGDTSEKIVNILENIKFTENLYLKKIR
jgi:GDP/UDP-N,N'-diacetylbacillosamine 2-epimerase (hydrolysing)